MKRYGFIGLGDQGAPIARRMIEAGFPVVLWARRPESLQPFSDTAAQLVATLEEFAGQVDVVSVCVVDDDGVTQLTLQLAPLLKPGSCLVIHSTVSPALCKSLAEDLALQGITLLDAPVSGGAPAARAGKLAVMAGGNRHIFDELLPMFKSFATHIVHLGGVGSGQHAKIINNAVLAANISIAWAGLEAAAALELDRAAFVDLINQSSGQSFGFGVAARMSEPTSFVHGGKLLLKDVGLLGAALDGHPAFEPIATAAHSFLSRALPDSF